jgi:adenosylhomocysteine nucleosidase
MPPNDPTASSPHLTTSLPHYLNAPCLIFALRRESQAFLQELRPQRRFPGAPCPARFYGPDSSTMLVLETGIGTDRTERALGWLLNRPMVGNFTYHPTVVISAGFAGSLQGDLQVGDLILATEVADSQGQIWSAPWPGPLPAGDPAMRRGRLLTMNRLIATPNEKRARGRQHKAMAVDMESATVAEFCRRKEVPFGCLRAISDSVDVSLSPKLISLLCRERISWLRLILALMGSPGLCGQLWRLHKATRLAGERLGQSLRELLTQSWQGNE